MIASTRFLLLPCLLLLAAPALARSTDPDDDDKPAASRPAPPQPDAPNDDDDSAAASRPQPAIVVTARRLDAARTRIAPDLGAATYTLTNDTIENRPGGETRSLGSVLVQMPGVRRAADGTPIVRGAPGGVQYRLNNIILPGGGDFGERLSARLADRTTLISGALPAQYGLASGGVVDVTTKNGLYEPGGQIELYGGSRRTIEPAFEWSGSSGASSLFASGSLRRSDVGIAAPDWGRPRHDASREIEGFVFADHVIDSTARVSLILGTTSERNQIPGVAAPGIAASASRHGDQANAAHYAIASVQKSVGAVSVQAALFALGARDSVTPDESISLAVDGVSRRFAGRRRSLGTQIEGAADLGARHIVRAGILASADRESDHERSLTPTLIYSANPIEHRTSFSAFVEDEWKLAPRWTVNGGVRIDRPADDRSYVEPRLSLVWAGPAGITAHAGIARYVVAPPLGDAAPRSALTGSVADPRPAAVERDDYLDLGAQLKRGGLTLGIDAYDRRARDLIAQRLWDDAPLGRSFNYCRGELRGVELAMTYAAGPLTAWSNLALAKAQAHGIATDRAEFTAAQLADVDRHRVPLDTDQRLTGSGGAGYHVGRLLLSGDLLYGSGTTRSSPIGVVNGARLPAHVTLDLAAVYRFSGLGRRPLDLRLDVDNAFDRRFAVSDGTALAGGAPQWARGRGVFVGFEQGF